MELIEKEKRNQIEFQRNIEPEKIEKYFKVQESLSNFQLQDKKDKQNLWKFLKEELKNQKSKQKANNPMN